MPPRLWICTVVDHQALEQRRKLIEWWGGGFKEKPAKIRMTYPQDAPALEHPMDLSERGDRCLQVLQHPMQEDGIKRRSREREGIERGDRETKVRDVPLRCLRSRKRHLVRLDVDTHDCGR
jgi:hypothetical protein